MSRLGSWWLDLKLGVRMLVKYPGLTLCGVVGIAVAVAIAAGGFSFVYVNLFGSSLPLEEGERIVAIELRDARLNGLETRAMRDFLDWREGLQSVRDISAYQTLTLNLIAPEAAPESVRVAAMSASGFGVARVRPLLGRYLEEADERAGSAAVVVIGEEIWRGRFGGDRQILGRSIRLGAASYSIVGVMPAGFRFPVNHQFWIPLRAVPAAEPLTGPPMAVFGRLAPGATMEAARAEVAAAGERTALAFPKDYATIRPRVTAYPLSVLQLGGPDDIAAIFAMEGIVVALLVLVCLNVAILVYTRTAMRQAEIGLRTALGAPRGRIVMQLFVEALVLAVVATAVGVGLAALAMRQVTAATQNIAADLPFWLAFRLSPAAVLYAGALSIVAAVIVGVVPGLQATGRNLQGGLRVVGAGEAGMRLGRVWSVLIVAQVAFAAALLPGAIGDVYEKLPYTLVGPGFAADEFLSAQLGMEGSESERYALRHAELMRRLAADARISHVTFAASEPGDERGARIEAEGASGGSVAVRVNQVDAGFFGAFDIPVLAGRGFDPGDAGPQAGAVVVNQILAEALFGGDALGRRIRYVAEGESMAEPSRWYEIAGIVPNFPSGVSVGMRDSQSKVYHAAAPGQLQPSTLLLGVRGDPGAYERPLREVAAAVDPDLFLRNVRSLDEGLRREQWIVRLEAAVVLGVTLSVLLLSSAGIYALMSFTVSQRRREIGIRMALGATQTSIITAVFSRAVKQVGLGAALGGGFWFALFGFFGGEPGRVSFALVAVVLVMLMVGLAAAFGPTRRSLRVQPTEALREQ